MPTNNQFWRRSSARMRLASIRTWSIRIAQVSVPHCPLVPKFLHYTRSPLCLGKAQSLSSHLISPYDLKIQMIIWPFVSVERLYFNIAVIILPETFTPLLIYAHQFIDVQQWVRQVSSLLWTSFKQCVITRAASHIRLVRSPIRHTLT